MTVIFMPMMTASKRLTTIALLLSLFLPLMVKKKRGFLFIALFELFFQLHAHFSSLSVALSPL